MTPTLGRILMDCFELACTELEANSASLLATCHVDVVSEG